MPKNLTPIILICAVILAISMGIRQSFGLYLTPISSDLSLDREVFALSMALMNLVWGLGAPIAGMMSDKYGPKHVIMFGALTYAAGLWLLSNATEQNTVLSAGLIMGLGISGTGFTAVLGAAGRAVSEDKRSIALGLVSMGGSAGQFLALPITHQLITGFGWSTSLIILSMTAAAMALLGLSMTSPGAQNQTAAPERDDSWQSVLRAALSNPNFLLLTTGFCVCGFHIAFVAVHLPAFLKDRGFDSATGATALTIIGAGNIVGTYFWGWAGGKFPKGRTLSLLYLARSLIFIPFLIAPITEPVVWLLSAALGLLWLGTIPLTSGLVASLFGPRWMSLLFGIVFLSHQIGAFFGSWAGGVLYDMLGNYDAMWWISIILGLTATMLHWPISERPPRNIRAQL